MMQEDKRLKVLGAGFALAAVVLTATTDLLAKLLAQGFPVQQVNFLAALIGIAGAWALSRKGFLGGGGLRTAHPWLMALRSVLTVGAAVCFFLAYKHLQLTEVFVFSALLPIFAGLMSGPVLGEPVAPRHWVALAASFLGVALVMPAPGGGQALWYAMAFGGTLFGAASLTLARLIGRSERNSAALVFYPQLALAVMMGLTLPGHIVPMAWGDVALTVLFGMGFLLGKMALAAAFSRAPAMVVTPVVNLQFFLLLGFGYVFFGDVPAQGIYFGAAIVTLSGLYVTFGSNRPARIPRHAALRLPAPANDWRRPDPQPVSKLRPRPATVLPPLAVMPNTLRHNALSPAAVAVAPQANSRL